MNFLHKAVALTAILTVTGFVTAHAENHVAVASPATGLASRPPMASTPPQLAAEPRGQAVDDALKADQAEATSTDEEDDCD